MLTSATLAASGGFAYLRGRLGLAEDLDERLIGSPFDFGRQALLYVPSHLPPPDKDPGPAYFDAIADEIARIVQLSEGRAFLLFTSRRALDEAYMRLLARVRYPLFRQGDMPPAKLLKAYLDSGCGCLLGNQTFWEGVRAKAKLGDARIHDLRHTFASLLVSGGMTLPMVGWLLGHTQAQTTLRYAHLYDDPLRAGLDEVGEALRPKLRLAS